jgi:hypothetical protein
VPSKWICPPFTVVHFLPLLTKIMAQSSRETGKGQRKGRTSPTNVVLPPSFSSRSSSVPFVGSVAATTASNVEKNTFLARQQVEDSKFPSWMYVSRHQGPGAKFKGGGNVL